MNNLKVYILLTVCIASLVSLTMGQLTFSPSWGKRNTGPQLNTNLDVNGGYANENCKTSVDLLMLIQQLIQAEAQKLRDCNQK